jgi:hypothetical protein
MRNPNTIATEMQRLRARASLSFVPLDAVAAIDLMIEFTAATCAALEAAGIIAPDAATDNNTPG